MTDRRGHASHFIPLLDNELLVGLVEEQRIERCRRSSGIEQIQFLGKGVADARGKAEAKQRCQGKHMFRAPPSVSVMLANMQVALMMAERIDDIQCFLVRPDDLWFAKG